MEFSKTPPREPYVGSIAVRKYLGGISNLTLHRWMALGLPVRRVGARGRLMFKCSEVDAWLDDLEVRLNRETPRAEGTSDAGVA